MTGMRELADYAASVTLEDLPPRVIDKVKACTLYGLAVGIASVGTNQPQRAADAARGERRGREGSATRLLDGAACSADAGAFANAALMHARCQEDAHPAGHVGVVVIPAALAAAEEHGSSGAEYLAAVTSGYEVALRIGRDHAQDLSARGFRTTPAYGVFGAAAAGGRIAGLRGDQMAHALGLAASTAGGLREFVQAGSDEFPYQAAFAARNGLTASALAGLGAVGPASALTGQAGFYAAFASHSAAYAARLCERLGTHFEVEAIGYKPYPTCQFHRGIVRGAIELRGEARGAALKRLEIRMVPGEADFWGVRFRGPFESFPQTFMSAPFCAALAWSAGRVTLADMHRFDDPVTLDLIDRIEVISEPGRAPYRPRLRATLSDGRDLVWEETAGADAYHLDWDAALRMSASLCAELGVPERHLSELTEIVASLERASDLSGLMRSAAITTAAADERRAPRVGARHLRAEGVR